MKKINKLTLTALLTATALILSYIENTVSAGILIPGIKLGLSNVSVVVALYTLGLPYALAIGVLKSLISLALFGRLSSLLYSVLGILFAIAAMYAIKRSQKFSLLSVSVGGSLSHIIGQLLAASILLKSNEAWKLFPILGILSVISGVITFIPERSILYIITKYNKKEVNSNAEQNRKRS